MLYCEFSTIYVAFAFSSLNIYITSSVFCSRLCLLRSVLYVAFPPSTKTVFCNMSLGVCVCWCVCLRWKFFHPLQALFNFHDCVVFHAAHCFYIVCFLFFPCRWNCWKACFCCLMSLCSSAHERKRKMILISLKKVVN